MTQLDSLEASLLGPLDVSQHLRIMPLGDSITVGYNGTPDVSYRRALASYIVEVQELGGPAAYVGSQYSPSGFHEGHAGWRLDEL
ncbi:MAG: hypothetical protein HOZ81_20545, partial [Streptomyces sp.]|nr:hypothetical protein [Streptomyces sp.]